VKKAKHMPPTSLPTSIQEFAIFKAYATNVIANINSRVCQTRSEHDELNTKCGWQTSLPMSQIESSKKVQMNMT
jgi:hypothetical protein